MAFETREGIPFLSLGELCELTRNLAGADDAAGLAQIGAGERLSLPDARGALGAARLNATGPQAHRIIDLALWRLGA